MVVRRFDAEGARLGDTAVSVRTGVGGDMTGVAPGGRALFAWNPVAATLTRVDLDTGDTSEGRGATAIADGGPFAALGDWLAPPVAAKTFLDVVLVVSPDGTRVYAAGLDPGAAARDVAGSSGIHVFDAASLDAIDRWDPTADFVSVAVSNDGRFVYAAGLAGFDTDGSPRPAQQASRTVYDAATGNVRLIAGQLGRDFLSFAFPTLD